MRSIESPIQANDDLTASRDGRELFIVEPGETWGAPAGQFRVSRVSMTTGQLSPAVTFTLPARRIAAGERDSIINASARATPRLEAQIRSLARLPEFYPPFTNNAAVAMGDGLLVLREYQRPNERLLVDMNSRTLTRLQVPASFTMFGLTRTHVWGALRDANDLPIVVRYRIM